MTYKITLQPSGKQFEVQPGEKILQAGLDAGLSLPYGCRMGTCNTCRAQVTDGEFDFGDAHIAYLPQSDRVRGLALLCQAKACSDMVIEVNELPKLVPPSTFPAMVRNMQMLAPDVMLVDLRLPLHQNFMFAAGQYIDLRLPGGIRRSYSIATTPATPMGVIDFQLHIRHMPGGLFTDRVFDNGLLVRQKVDVEGPLGTFFLREDSDKPIVMVASGTGFAPLRSILLDMFRRGIERPVTLYWGGRVRPDIYLFDEAQSWAKEYAHFDFVPVLSDARPEDDWNGRQGFVHRAVLEDFKDLSGYQVYACGAPIVVASARKDFTEQCGLPADEFYADSFVSQADAAGA